MKSTKLGEEVREETLDAIRNNKISGRSFLELTQDDLKELTALIGERKALSRVISSYAPKVS